MCLLKEELMFKKFLASFAVVRGCHRNFLRLREKWSRTRQFRVISLLSNVPNYLNSYRKFLNLGGKIDAIYPIISDFNQNAGVQSGHYFHQDLLVAQLIYEAKPNRHIDVGSRIDGFVAHVASFRKIEVLDIRSLPQSTHSNIDFYQADLMEDVEESITDSVSCLHALEHFGLGRYNDKIDPEGHVKGLQNLIKMLQAGGKLYLSFPIGTSDQVLFNAHRIFHPKTVLDWAPAELILERFDYVDDSGELFLNVVLNDLSVEMQYGCGIYTFTKVNKP